MNLAKFASDLFIEVRNYVQPAIDELNKTVSAVEKSLLEIIEKKLSEMPAPQAGEKGADGKDGLPGANGKDADPECIKRLINEALSGLPSPQAGEKGADGKDGLPGANGKDADLEIIQKMIDAAVAEAVKNIPVAKDGDAGVDGRDALDIEILPEIDQSKCYARGTYAKHKNGLWRSFERTHGLKGWECIVAGIAALEIPETDDPRNISVVAMLSDGQSSSKGFYIPSVIYRGVFTQRDYAKGDTVSWGGSIWHCDESTSDKPGEPGSKGWTLAVKRGQNGKDGRDGRDLVKGVSIK